MIIESGSDASGKATQSNLLYHRLLNDGYRARKVEYPNYNSDSSALVKMYLNGDFGEQPGDVNPYVASTFFAVDRFASFKREWEDFYMDGGIIIADRYTTSNMVHQAAKFLDVKTKDEFLNWLWNFEFRLFQLPEPDVVFFLDLPPLHSKRLLQERMGRGQVGENRDIHELDDDYLRQSYHNALYVADKYGWVKIACTDGMELLSIEDIHEAVYHQALNHLGALGL